MASCSMDNKVLINVRNSDARGPLDVQIIFYLKFLSVELLETCKVIAFRRSILIGDLIFYDVILSLKNLRWRNGIVPI
jgi:hypothetical protein